MRRPVKPFVTEYKANQRRVKESPGSNGRGSQPPEIGWGLNAPRADEGETSYEAAMRAADALFSTSGQPAPRPADPTPPADAHGFADTAAHAGPQQVFRAEPQADAVFAKIDATPRSDGTRSDGTRGEDVAADEGRGRILQAIEEPGPDPFAAMEAERAPKRRGRKPGSRNKPKPYRDSAALDEPAAGDRVLAGWSSSDDVDVVPLGFDAPETVVAARSPDLGVVRTPAVALASTAFLDLPPRTGPRFAWVRTKLRPGQKWKRRLPKIAW